MRWRYRKPNDLFEKVEVYIPKSIMHILREVSDERVITPERLVAMAVDNELDCVPKFNYPCVTPETIREYDYAGAAKKIYDLLTRLPHGTTKESIVLCRRDIGIESREEVLGGIRELIDKKMVVEEKINRSSAMGGEGRSMIRTMGRVAPPVERFRRFEGDDLANQRPRKITIIDDGERGDR
jgi:hypothetical protein